MDEQVCDGDGEGGPKEVVSEGVVNFLNTIETCISEGRQQFPVDDPEATSNVASVIQTQVCVHELLKQQAMTLKGQLFSSLEDSSAEQVESVTED